MGNFNKKFNARNPLKHSGGAGSGAVYSSATQSPLGYSPLKQMEEWERLRREETTEGKTGGNIGLLPSEIEETWVYEGPDLTERIIDYEDRIEFLETDLAKDAEEAELTGTSTDKKQLANDLAILKQELAKLRGPE
jgi:hypothetical protein|tara:strand:- start:211 stop:618 length:408 start_codon:yes stop_codon:yes gene_type:complete